MSVGSVYLESITKRFMSSKELGDKTFAQLRDEDFDFRPNEESNSIAILIHHMAGNMLSRWTNFLTEDGEKSWRHRDEEFEVQSYTRQQWLDLWEKGWACLFSSLGALQEDDLLKTVSIRGEQMPAIDALNRQFAHQVYHIGQILYIGKMLKGKDWKNLSMPKKS